MTDDGRYEAGYTDDAGDLILALLFVLSRPVSDAELAQVSGLTREEAAARAEALRETLSREDGALVIRKVDGRYQLAANQKFYERISALISSAMPQKLSEAQLETLAVIAGLGSATRIDIEKVRGVSSDSSVGKLVEYGLIEEKGRLDVPGRPVVFGPTDEFFRRYGVESADDLPRLEPEEKAAGIAAGEGETIEEDALSMTGGQKSMDFDPETAGEKSEEDARGRE